MVRLELNSVFEGRSGSCGIAFFQADLSQIIPGGGVIWSPCRRRLSETPFERTNAAIQLLAGIGGGAAKSEEEKVIVWMDSGGVVDRCENFREFSFALVDAYEEQRAADQI